MFENEKHISITAIRSAIVNKNREQLMTKAIRTFTEAYGTLTNVRVNTEDAKILLEIKLKGEDEITKIGIYGFSLVRDKFSFSMKFKKIITSKKWLNAIIEKHGQFIFPDNEIRIQRSIMMDIYFFFL